MRGQNLLVGTHKDSSKVQESWERTFGERKKQDEPFVKYVMCYKHGKLHKEQEQCEDCKDNG